MLARRTGRRRINEALAVASPLAFADAVRNYITSLEPDALHDLVLESIKGMDAYERMQFAMFLGHDSPPGGIDDVFSAPTMPVADLQRFVEECKDFLPERFAAFLHETPRAVATLGYDAIESVLSKLPQMDVDRAPRTPEERSRRITLQGALVLGFSVLVALVPLAAQYVHQRGMVAGISNASFMPQAPRTIAVRPPAAPAKQIPPRAHRHVTQAPKKHAGHRAIAMVPARPAAAPHARLHHAHRAQPVRVAKIWKFDPRYNPYSSGHRAAIAHVASVATAKPQPATSMSPFEARARFVVSSYLHAVISGNTPSALAHLGLPVGSDPKAISESAIVSRDARAQIVAVKPAEGGETHVQVDIVGRRGEYFEVFSVAPDGPAVRIKDRFYIPVNRTAEEISARLLAKITH